MKCFQSLLLTLLATIVFVACSNDKIIVSPSTETTYTQEQVRDMIPGNYLDSCNVEQCMHFATFDYKGDMTLKSRIYYFENDSLLNTPDILGTWRMLDVNLQSDGDTQYFAIESTFNMETLFDSPAMADSLKAMDMDMIVLDTALVVVTPGHEVGLITLESLHAMGFNEVQSMGDLIASGGAQSRGIFSDIWENIKQIGATVKKKIINEWDVVTTEIATTVLGGKRYETAPDYADWMGNISDEIPVCHISIPGTHDTFTQCIQPLASLWGQTQVFNLEGLWNRGCRQFDIRPGYNPDNQGDEQLKVVHENNLFYCNITVKQVLQKIENLLEKHPSETAIVVFRIDADGGDREKAKSMLGSVIDMVSTEHVARWTPGITMKEARGRMIMICRDGNLGTKNTVVEPTGWGKDNKLICGHYATGLYVQDQYEMKAKEIVNVWYERKKAAIRDAFEFKGQNMEDNYVWTVNHTSGFTCFAISNLLSISNLLYPKSWISMIEYNSGLAMSYSQNAGEINPYANDYLKSHEGKYTGIITMDFFGSSKVFANFATNTKELPVTIINHNKTLYWHGTNFWK